MISLTRQQGAPPPWGASARLHASPHLGLSFWLRNGENRSRQTFMDCWVNHCTEPSLSDWSPASSAKMHSWGLSTESNLQHYKNSYRKTDFGCGVVASVHVLQVFSEVFHYKQSAHKCIRENVHIHTEISHWPFLNCTQKVLCIPASCTPCYVGGHGQWWNAQTVLFLQNGDCRCGAHLTGLSISLP